MAVFRVEKTRDYTVMANYHLRNTELSLKAKDLLSLMLSLPENWDYTTKGLSYICKDGIDSINATVRELEEQGYVICRRLQSANERLEPLNDAADESGWHYRAALIHRLAKMGRANEYN